MIQLLSISVAIIFFANKIFVLIGKRTGWLLGVIAAILAIFYFYLIELYVYTALEFGLIALMGYGFLVKNHKSKLIENFIYSVITLVMLTLTYFIFSGAMTVYEFVSSVGLLFGTYFLTHEKTKFGWACYSLRHLISVYIMYDKDQQFFADFQLASAVVAMVGVIISFKKS